MPARRWIASVSREYTKISNSGTGFGIAGTREDWSLKLIESRSGRNALVRTIASMVPSVLRMMLSWSSEFTSRSAWWMDWRISSISSSPAASSGSNFDWNSATSFAAISGFAAIASLRYSSV